MKNSNLKMSNKEYGEYVDKLAPKSSSIKDILHSFIFGGLICCVGEAILMMYKYFNLGETAEQTATSITLIFLGSLLTALHLYDRLADIAKAGSLVPITGFANSVAAPGIEFRSEGLVTGTGAKMFVIAGPVIVYGVSASIIYGLIYFFISK